MPLKQSTYDELPYTSSVMPYAHPNRLATIAQLFGLPTASLEKCRILELGCADASHLFATAYSLPNAECWGVDSNAEKIEQAQPIAEGLGLKNVVLKNCDILDVDDSFGMFDYIIAHGIYSWSSQAVQEKIIHICKHHLTENGVAYVSYSTKPGALLSDAVRDLLHYQVVGIPDGEIQKQQLSAVLSLLAQSGTEQDNAYGKFLAAEVEKFDELPDPAQFVQALTHEHTPVYFHEFMNSAAQEGLQYLGDAHFHTLFNYDLPESSVEMLKAFDNDLITKEQYTDFLRNRHFRHTLLCHDNAQVSRQISPSRLDSLAVASSLQANADDPSRFSQALGSIKTESVFVQMALRYIAERWARPVPIEEVVAAVAEACNQAVSQVEGEIKSALLEFYSRNLIELHKQSPEITAQVSAKPRASLLARWQAERTNQITNLRHEVIFIEDALYLRLLPHVNGENDHDTLVKQLSSWLEDGGIAIQAADGTNINQLSEVDTHKVLHTVLENALSLFAQAALLEA